MLINEYIIFYQSDSNSFGVRRATEILPSGSAPAAIVTDGKVLWQAGYGSVSFPYADEVSNAVASFEAHRAAEGDAYCTGWELRQYIDEWKQSKS